MEKILAYVIDIIIAILIIFAAVFLYFGLRTETVVKTLGTHTTKEFITDIKKSGYFTLNEYETFVDRLSLTNAIFNIDFEHKYKLLEPEYRLRNLQEILDAQNAAYAGSNIYTYREIKTDKPIVSDPISNGSLNTETNASVMAKAVNTPADPNHIHGSACYEGSGHIPVYGSTNLSKVPVYIQRFTRQVSGWHEDTVYSINCAICGDPIYQIYTTNYAPSGKQEGGIIYYINEGGNRVEHKINFSVPANYNSDGAVNSIINPLYNLLVEHGGTSQNNYISHDFNWPYSTIPCMDVNGTRSDIAFPGCSSIYNHPNANACWPVGHMGKVKIQFWDSKASDSRDLQVIIKCADCGKEIVSLSLNNQRGFHAQYSEYTNGIRTYKIYYAKHVDGGYQENYWYYVTSLNLQSSDLFNHFYEIGKTLPGYVWPESFLNFETPPIDCPFKTLPIRHRLGDMAPIMWIPYRGCSYCSPYGTSYTCGPDHVAACDQLVTSITPTHANQTVAVGDPLITTVKANYLNGATKTVIAETNFSTASVCQNKNATLTYKYVIAGITYTKTCNITVTVIPRTKTCPKGHTYNLNANGSDPGCPYCKAWVDNIRFLNPSGNTLTITIGTTLIQNGVKLLVTYMDGHTETILSGYVDNLDTAYLGTTQVTVGYKGATAQLWVTTVCAKMTCAICGYAYDLYPDGTDPGCPRCISKIPVFTGNILEYEETEYTEPILEKLFQDGIYEFNKDDTFSITLQNKSKNVGRNLLRKFIPGITDRWFDLRMSERISK